MLGLGADDSSLEDVAQHCGMKVMNDSEENLEAEAADTKLLSAEFGGMNDELRKMVRNRVGPGWDEGWS